VRSKETRLNADTRLGLCIEQQGYANLVKVGYSTKDPHLRVEELRGTGLPHPFEVEYDALVFDPRDVEQAVHAELRGEHEAKEFYRVSASEAVRTIRQIVKVQQKQVIAEHIRTPEPEMDLRRSLRAA